MEEIIIPELAERLPVMESFYTIQGEGFNTGKPAYFIRLGGCDVGCVWCDVKESWDKNAHPLLSADEIIRLAGYFPSGNIVITGGEPFMYNLKNLSFLLKSHGFQNWVETSGAYPITGTWDWICVSPKKFKAPLRENLEKADELKVIIFNKSDFEWAETHASSVNNECQLFLQPEWSKKDQVIPLIVEYVKENPKWKISLQTHKFLNIP